MEHKDFVKRPKINIIKLISSGVKILTVFVAVLTLNTSSVMAEIKPLILHVKTSLSVDDAQICVVPNVAWAALAKKRPVTIVFDGSAVTSVARGYGW